MHNGTLGIGNPPTACQSDMKFYERTMIDPVATVIIPTFDHGRTLALAVQSALAQSVAVEIFIIGDGVPEANKQQIHDLAEKDARITFFDFPKHPSRGEPYRDNVIATAKGRIIAYLCDRDIWFPNHVASLDEMLQNADFCHSLPLHVFPAAEIRSYTTDLSIPIHRYNMTHLWNRVPLSCAAHSTAFYRSLEKGWEETPAGQLTDWFFFKKFLLRQDCRFVSGVLPTALTFPTRPRPDWTEDQRVDELAQWLDRLTNERLRQALTLDILKVAVKQRDRMMGELYLKLFDLQKNGVVVPASAPATLAP